MRVVIGSDKAGFNLKSSILKHLEGSPNKVIDLGPTSGEERVSFVEIADRLSQTILAGDADRGILVCGTGMGMSLAANKHKGIYAAVVESVYAARMCRLINNANVLCMGGFIIGNHMAAEIVDEFLTTEYLENFEQWRKDFLNSQLQALQKIEENNFK